MMIGSVCNSVYDIGLLDYAYLALNVYNSPKDDKLLGFRPQKVDSIESMKKMIDKQQGWFHLDFPRLKITSGLHNEYDFYAELYVKVYYGKIQHIMTAFRGTCKKYDIAEDISTWWKTILPYSDHFKSSIPEYWDYASTFIMTTSRIISLLDNEGLLTQWCGQHFTGHSLGGALANMVSGFNMICMPAQMHSHLPVALDVISFNAPGIGNIKHVDNALLNQERVISMRAKYDMVSALGKPYGYVINNMIPEGLSDAREAFTLENNIEHESLAHKVTDIAAKATALAGLPTLGLAENHLNQRLQQTLDGKSLYEQHSMDNFFKVLASCNDTTSMNFQDLQKWSQQHGQFNADLKAETLFGNAVEAMVA